MPMLATAIWEGAEPRAEAGPQKSPSGPWAGGWQEKGIRVGGGAELRNLTLIPQDLIHKNI